MKHSLIAYLIVLLALVSCRGGETTHPSSPALKLSYAERIDEEHLSLLGGNYDRIAVDASVYKGLMDMLGVGNKCIDFSQNMKLDVEKVIAAKPDLLLLSAYEGSDVEKFKKMGIPIVECTDFLETSPLARAEWMRFFGRLWGVGEKADSLFASVEKNYKNLCDDSDNTKTVFFDLIYGNIWYQPSPLSTIGQLVFDAGGSIPFEINQVGGSLSLSVEQVLLQAKDADFWLIRANSNQQLSLESLAKMNPAYSQFKAFKKGNVFVCYTDKTNYFEDSPFRPDWLLEDFRAIISPSTAKGRVELRYFRKIK